MFARLMKRWRGKRTTPTAAELIAMLGLEPLPGEGGFYRRTYIGDADRLDADFPDGFPDHRPLISAIYYLITPDSYSLFHRLGGHEVLHFYLGDPVDLYVLEDGGDMTRQVLGADVTAGQHPQYPVPAGRWFAMSLRNSGSLALLGATVAPAFDWDRFTLGERESLLVRWPDHAEIIRRHTPAPGPE